MWTKYLFIEGVALFRSSAPDLGFRSFFASAYPVSVTPYRLRHLIPFSLCLVSSEQSLPFRYALPPQNTSSERFAPTFSSRRRLEIRGTHLLSLPLEGKVPSETRRMRWPDFCGRSTFSSKGLLCSAAVRLIWGFVAFLRRLIPFPLRPTASDT